MDQILHGNAGSVETALPIPGATANDSLVVEKRNEFDEFHEIMKLDFINAVRGAEGIADVCQILGVPMSAFIVFAQLLAPDAKLERLAESFRTLVLSLLQNRNRDAESVKPTVRLFGGSALAIEHKA